MIGITNSTHTPAGFDSKAAQNSPGKSFDGKTVTLVHHTFNKCALRTLDQAAKQMARKPGIPSKVIGVSGQVFVAALESENFKKGVHNICELMTTTQNSSKGQQPLSPQANDGKVATKKDTDLPTGSGHLSSTQPETITQKRLTRSISAPANLCQQYGNQDLENLATKNPTSYFQLDKPVTKRAISLPALALFVTTHGVSAQGSDVTTS
ncbi:hypothetical protein [Candidatus Sororendozoicomonas aggregata]|uniref:hypothetical protein n=1 Tax=Candidatus Sororendozoicomonas aggregata TaxID=3073239 RepID=UPI002ED61970